MKPRNIFLKKWKKQDYSFIKKINKIYLIFYFTINLSYAESRISKLYHWSEAALIVGNSVDGASSWGKYESNPLLKDNTGQFGTKGVAIKTGVVIGILLSERYICKKEKKEKWPLTFGILNMGIGAVTTGVAVRNWRMK